MHGVDEKVNLAECIFVPTVPCLDRDTYHLVNTDFLGGQSLAWQHGMVTRFGGLVWQPMEDAAAGRKIPEGKVNGLSIVFELVAVETIKP